MNNWWHLMMSMGILYTLAVSITAYENAGCNITPVSQGFFYLSLFLAFLNIWSPF